MLIGESSKSRLIMGRLNRGDNLEEGILRVCAETSIRCGEIRLIGALSHAELCAYDQKKQAYGPSRKFSGNLEILSVLGNVSEKSGDRSIHLHATLARDTDNGIQVIGGHLLSAKVFACEYAIQACDDLILRRSYDDKTGLSLWNEKIQFPPIDEETACPASALSAEKQSIEPEKKSSGEVLEDPPGETYPKTKTKKLASTLNKDKTDVDSEAAGDVSWDDVLAASLKRSKDKSDIKPSSTESDRDPQDEDQGKQSGNDFPPEDAGHSENPSEEEEEPWENTVEPQPGDILIHPQFGKCKVERLEEGEFLHVRLESGRSIRLNMDILNLHLSGFEKDKQIFETRIGH